METRDAVYGRRSIRLYQDKPIDGSVLEDIMEGAVMAPSAVNNQPWFFLVLHSAAQMEKLRGIFAEVGENIKEVLEKRFPNNPEVVAETLGFMRGLGGAKACVLAFLLKPADEYDIIALQSTCAAIENLCLMAYDQGLGSCWMTAALTAGYGPVLEQEFAPGKGKFVAAITLGYPAVVPKAPKRKPGRYEII